jgi:signal transduction histidine kinase
VEVSATFDDDCCHLVVADDGIGIDAARREEVFEMFNRGPSPEAPGSGIGLAITARVVENHRGRIRIDDNPGGGTRVCVELPRRAEPAHR